MRGRLKKPLSFVAAAALLEKREADFQTEIRAVTEYLAIAIAAVTNTFNPTTVFVRGKLLVEKQERFVRVLERACERTLESCWPNARSFPVGRQWAASATGPHSSRQSRDFL